MNKLLTILFVIFLSIFVLGCIDGQDGNGGVTGPVPAVIQVTSTSPHVADNVDSSAVAITMLDGEGNGLEGRELEVSGYLPVDVKESFNVVEMSNGNYIALVNSPQAGNMLLKVKDVESGLEETSNIEFKAGEAKRVFLETTDPRKSETGDASYVKFWAEDEFGNIVKSPDTSFNLEITEGSVGSIDYDYSSGIFETSLSFDGIGIIGMTVTETKSNLTTSGDIYFSPLFLEFNEGGFVGDDFSIDVGIYIPSNKHGLDSYYLYLYYNDEVLFLDTLNAAEDPDLSDAFNVPEISESSPGMLTLYQSKELGKPAPKGKIKVAKVNFITVGTGAIYADITTHGEGLLDAEGGSIFLDWSTVGGVIHIPEAVILNKNYSELCIHIWNIANAVTEQRIDQDVNRLKDVFKKAAWKCCPRFRFDITRENINFNTWNITIDLNHDGKLDEFNDPKNPTAEERALMENFKDVDCVNIYYVPDFSSGRTTGQSVGREDHAAGNGIFARTDSNNNTMAHELGHFLNLSHDEYNKTGGICVEVMVTDAGGNKKSKLISNNTNLLYPYGTAGKDKLSECQCEVITKRFNALFP